MESSRADLASHWQYCLLACASTCLPALPIKRQRRRRPIASEAVVSDDHELGRRNVVWLSSCNIESLTHTHTQVEKERERERY